MQAYRSRRTSVALAAAFASLWLVQANAATAQTTDPQRMIEQNNRALNNMLRDQDASRQQGLETQSIRRRLEQQREQVPVGVPPANPGCTPGRAGC